MKQQLLSSILGFILLLILPVGRNGDSILSISSFLICHISLNYTDVDFFEIEEELLLEEELEKERSTENEKSEDFKQIDFFPNFYQVKFQYSNSLVQSFVCKSLFLKSFSYSKDVVIPPPDFSCSQLLA